MFKAHWFIKTLPYNIDPKMSKLIESFVDLSFKLQDSLPLLQNLSIVYSAIIFGKFTHYNNVALEQKSESTANKLGFALLCIEKQKSAPDTTHLAGKILKEALKKDSEEITSEQTSQIIESSGIFIPVTAFGYKHKGKTKATKENNDNGGKEINITTII